MSNSRLKRRREKALRVASNREAWALGYSEAYRVAKEAEASENVLEALKNYLKHS